MEIHLTTTKCHLPYGITQCYLPPDTSERTPVYSRMTSRIVVSDEIGASAIARI